MQACRRFHMIQRVFPAIGCTSASGSYRPSLATSLDHHVVGKVNFQHFFQRHLPGSVVTFVRLANHFRPYTTQARPFSVVTSGMRGGNRGHHAGRSGD